MKTLRQIREDRGVSKVAIARYLGISRPTYDAYENRPSQMKIETAQKVASFLCVDLADIFFLSNSN